MGASHRQGGVSIKFDFRTAYAIAVATSIVASVLTIVYVGGSAAQESNPVTAALIGEFGLLPAMAIRTVAVVVLYWAYHYVGVAAAIPRVALVFAWFGATINSLDAAGNVAVAVLVGPTGVSPESALAIGITVVLAAVALRIGPPLEVSFPDADRTPEATQTP